ncbi:MULTISPECIES: NUDIX hydrolase [Brachybacterium]|uniref:NUDIX hydrolase n=1 Tax=Brachybacterium TaxID=43668 RepID=UPI000F07F34E|nr:NUDIX domain-containing protein [Brachybacterium sp. EE-P12]
MDELGSSVRVCAYVVSRRDGAILLAHQVSPGPAYGMWTLPGGGAEFGEHPRDAAVREVREETGCEVAIGALLGVHSGLFEAGGGSQQHVVRLLFEGDVLGEPRVAQPDEVNAVEWHPHRSLPPNTTAWAALGAELLH